MMGDWTFFSNYGHVIVCLAKNHESRLRDVASEVGITERAVQKIVRDLQDADFVTVTKQGRCNRYRLNKRKALRHQLEAKCTIGQLLSLVTKPGRIPQTIDAEEKTPQIKTEPISETIEAAEPVSSTRPAAQKKAVSSKKPDSSTKPDSSAKPVDTRQQGKLF
jgi:DNA-binding IscR family transcriptional regulator